jgi:hypothetical protein
MVQEVADSRINELFFIYSDLIKLSKVRVGILLHFKASLMIHQVKFAREEI